MAAVQSANVPFCLMLVDPWVDGFGAPMFELDLHGWLLSMMAH